jgi:hypothetical protein
MTAGIAPSATVGAAGGGEAGALPPSARSGPPPPEYLGQDDGTGGPA